MHQVPARGEGPLPRRCLCAGLDRGRFRGDASGRWRQRHPRHDPQEDLYRLTGRVAGMSPMPDRDPFIFIDLARLGRTDWWSGVKAFLRILGWQILILTPYIVVLGVIAYWRDL